MPKATKEDKNNNVLGFAHFTCVSSRVLAIFDITKRLNRKTSSQRRTKDTNRLYCMILTFAYPYSWTCNCIHRPGLHMATAIYICNVK